jgi:serine/threonine protein kinase
LPIDDFTEAKKLHERFRLASDTPLGSGSFGVVQKVQFHTNNRSICLARKLVRRPHRRYPMQLLREEANVMERLVHEHIIKLVGTYCIQDKLYLLLWPVAVCNLDILLSDIDSLRTGEGDTEDIVSRLHSLDLKDLDAVKQPRAKLRNPKGQGNCPIEFLREIMGCVTRALAYCHSEDVRHLDLKPSNILINPGRVYLADFGIAKDVHDRDNTMTRGAHGTPKWRAPESQQCTTDWSMKAADVYSLGMVLLNITTAISYGPLDEFDAMLCDMSHGGRMDKLNELLQKVEALALATQEFEDVKAPTFGPRHPVQLIRMMVSENPDQRPKISQVDNELIDLGGIDQVYHAQCCKASPRAISKRLNARYKEAIEERNHLRAENETLSKRVQVLEAKDATYESRIAHERKAQLDTISKLQAQLDKERVEKKNLEAKLAELQRRQPRIPRPATVFHSKPDREEGVALRQRQTHPIPNSVTVQQPRAPTTRVQQPSPAPSVTSNGAAARLTYSQTVAASAASAIAAAQAGIKTPNRRDSLIPSPSPSPLFAHSHSPSPTPTSATAILAGYPLRSRPSGSRLPIRTTTPLTPGGVQRDLSSTDSTQYSMSSSVFDRLSGSKASLAETSVMSTPPQKPEAVIMTRQGSRTVLDMRRPGSPPPKPRQARPAVERERRMSNAADDEFEEVSRHGLGLGSTDPVDESQSQSQSQGERERVRRESQNTHERFRRESVVSYSSMGCGGGAAVNAGTVDGGSVRGGDSASVASFVIGAGTTTTASPEQSALSSPQPSFASLERNGARVMIPPSLPTGKSWAEVARREKKKVPQPVQPVHPVQPVQ